MNILPKDFKIGARTVKTVIAASLAIIIANLFHLQYATAAGVIAILSVGNTKKSTFKSGKNRLLNFLAAMVLSVILFSILGHSVWVFGVFLLIFIPYSAACGMSEGIAPNAVLVTHLLIAPQITPQLLFNEFLLNFIAISLAFIVNIKMPNFQAELSEREKRVEHHFRDLFKRLSFIMAKQTEQVHFLHKVEDLELYSYENELIQALINILNNSRDELIKKPVEEEKYIFVDVYKNDKNEVNIVIKDNAGGIKEEYLNKIFEPYFTTKHKSQGTGIGLYMTEEIITKHLDGEIYVKNKEFIYNGKEYIGAQFRIVLNLSNDNE